MERNDLEFEQALAEAEKLLNWAARDDAADKEAELDRILAEFGGGKKKDEERPSVPLSEALAEDKDESEEEPFDLSMLAPQGVKLQTVLEQTVSSVLEEEEAILPPKRRGLFSRKSVVETEQLYEKHDKEEAPPPPPNEEPEDENTDIFDTFPTEEESFEDVAADYRDLTHELREASGAALLVTVLMWIPLLLDRFGLMPALYREERLLHCLPYFIALALTCVLARDVFVFAFERLREKAVSFELLSSLTAIAALADTALSFFFPARSTIIPFHAVAALSLTAALWGRSLLFSSMYDTFRLAAAGDASYLVTMTMGGAAKRRGESRGFVHCAQSDDVSAHWQALLLPVVLAATLVFALLSTAQGRDWTLFFWNWTALLSAGNMLAFPLVYSLPFRSLTKRFFKSGAALGGYVGADLLRRSNCMILTDGDLFPPGTVELTGPKTYGEERRKAVAYAAAMMREASCGLSRIFDALLDAEGALPPRVDDLNFFEDGGLGATIHGEAVLLGTAGFLRRMGVILPNGLKLKTGIFLSVDKELIAVFSAKYLAAENVDWALHSLKRNAITPVLAVRDANITPGLLKRKFGTDAKAVYPKMATRLALSEKEGVKPCALIFREGLMPFAEVTIGAKRLVRAVKRGNRVSLIGSVLSTLLAFYLTFVGAYATLTAETMALYLLLWSFAALVDAALVDRY